MCARPANPELRGKILDAATEIIEGCGPDCVTMREVAEKVGYSSTTLYLYFRDKGDLLKATVMRAFDDLGESLAAAAVGPRPIDEFRQRARAYVVWGLMHPNLYQLMFAPPGDIEWRDGELVETTKGWTDAVRVVEECVAAGEIPPVDDVAAFGATVWAALHGATSLAISGRLLGTPSAELPVLIGAASATAETILDRLIGAA